MSFTAFAIASVIAALIGAGAGVFGSAMNAKSVDDTNKSNREAVESTNEANLTATRETNAMQMDLAKNGISYRVQDLENAGLNKNLAAGGVGTPTASLSVPNARAAQAQAPMMDLSGVSSALNAATNSLLTIEMLRSRNTLGGERNDIMSEKNKILDNLYRRKGLSYADNMANIGSAKQIGAAMSRKDVKALEKDWDKLMKELQNKPGKFDKNFWD